MANHSREIKGTYFKSTERNSVQYSMELTKTHHDWLVKTARDMRCSRSKVIKEMIQAAINLEQQDTPHHELSSLSGDASGQRSEAGLHARQG